MYILLDYGRMTEQLFSTLQKKDVFTCFPFIACIVRIQANIARAVATCE